MDAFAASAYLILVVLEVLVLILAAILNPIAYYRRRRAKVDNSVPKIKSVDQALTLAVAVIQLESDSNDPADPPDELVQWF